MLWANQLLIYKVIYLSTILSSVVFALFIFINTRREKFNVLYALTNIAIVIWALGRYALLVSTNHETALLWARILHVGSILVHLLFLHSILVFTGVEKERRWLLTILYANALFALFLNANDVIWQTGIFIKDVVPRLIFPWIEVGGSLYGLHLINELIIPTWAFAEIVLGYFREKDIKREQIRYIMISSFLGFIGGNTVIFLIYNIPIMPYGVWLVPLSFITMTYAIFRYKLMSFKTIATEAFVFAILITLLVQTTLATSIFEMFLRAMFFVVVAIFSYLLVRSVLKEVKTREEMEILAKKLEFANARLKQLDKLKSDFVTIASHQLRSPITAIKGYASMLMENSYGKMPSAAQVALDRIFQSSGRLSSLIDDFLNLSRIERGKMEYNFAEADLREMVESLMEEFKIINEKQKNGLDLSLEIAGGKKENYIINMDAAKIRQVISNIIDNATKYTKKGFVKVHLYKRTDRPNVAIEVQDSGIGMNREGLIKIFQKFSRVESNGDTSKHVEGLGLGLYVATEILKQHHGRVWAESEGEGKGSTFHLELPLK